MQKNALIILIALAFLLPPGAFSQQRIIDMEIVISQPSVGEIVQSGEQVPFTVYLKNNGPGPLVEGDTLFCRLPDGSGQVLLLPQPVNAGDSLVVMDTELTLTAESSATVDLCFAVIPDPNSEVTLDGGPVQVSYIDTNRNNNMMCHNVIVENEEPPSGIAGDINETQLTVYPNPVTSVLHVAAPSYPEGTYSIRVSDLLGRIVMQRFPLATSGQLTLDVSTLLPGTYILELLFQKGTTMSTRFMVAPSK